MRTGEGSPRDFAIHGKSQSFPIRLFQLLQRLRFTVLHGFERNNLIGIGGLPGLTGVFPASAWWRRHIHLGMIPGRQRPNINARLLESNRPRERKERFVDPLTSGRLVKGVDASPEAGNVTS